MGHNIQKCEFLAIRGPLEAHTYSDRDNLASQLSSHLYQSTYKIWLVPCSPPPWIRLCIVIRNIEAVSEHNHISTVLCRLVMTVICGDTGLAHSLPTNSHPVFFKDINMVFKIWGIIVALVWWKLFSASRYQDLDNSYHKAGMIDLHSCAQTHKPLHISHFFEISVCSRHFTNLPTFTLICPYLVIFNWVRR